MAAKPRYILQQQEREARRQLSEATNIYLSSDIRQRSDRDSITESHIVLRSASDHSKLVSYVLKNNLTKASKEELTRIKLAVLGK